MKKFIYALIVLAIAGAVLSALLLVQHYFPGSQIAGMTCGDGLDNPCHNLSLSGYASVRGFPVAAMGLFFYLFILFTLLVADYAGDDYYTAAALLVLPLVTAALIADIFLAAILFKTGQFCRLCVATYAINILMTLTAFMWVRECAGNDGRGPLTLVTGTSRGITGTSGGRAALGLFVLFTALLGFSVFSTTAILEKKSGKREFTQKQIDDYVKSFYALEVEQLDLPDSPMVLGNPRAQVTIIAFTDFLCSACYNFFDTEKYLMARFPGKVSIAYYGFPLDRGCNPTISRTVYENSCIASRAVNAAAQTGILEQYLKVHFNHYAEIKHGYTEETAMSIFVETMKYAKKQLTADDFIKALSSETVDSTVRNDIELARENDIQSTPTLFIGGRRMRGAPPKEMLEAVIRTELARKDQQAQQ